MRERSFIIIFTALSILSIKSQNTWFQQNSGTTRNLEQLSFPDPLTGFVVGEKGTILKTINSGLNWYGTFTDTSRNFVSVSFTSALTGYALTNDRVYRTLNGGTSWQLIYSDSSAWFLTVCFVNDSTGFIGTTVSILKTDNYGNTWNIVKVTTNPINTIHFPSPQTGYFAGGPNYSDQIYVTNNLGQSFSNLLLGQQSIKERLFFLNDSVGYLAGWYGSCLAKTTNRGQTWVPLNALVDAQAWDVHFSDVTNGHYIDNSGGFSKIKRTSDGGNSWVTDAGGNSYTYKKFIFTSTGQGFAVGKSGGIYSTQTTNALQKQQPDDSWKIYPNPCSGIIYVKGVGLTRANITDQLGRSVWQSNYDSGQYQVIETGELPAGVYIFEGDDGTVVHKQKLIIFK